MATVTAASTPMLRPLVPRLPYLWTGLDSGGCGSIEAFGGVGVVEEGVFHAEWCCEALCNACIWASGLGTLCPFCGQVEGSRNTVLFPSIPWPCHPRSLLPAWGIVPRSDSRYKLRRLAVVWVARLLGWQSGYKISGPSAGSVCWPLVGGFEPLRPSPELRSLQMCNCSEMIPLNLGP